MVLGLSIYYFKRKANKQARNILASKLSPSETGQLLKDYWHQYKKHRKDLPVQKTLGAKIMIHLSGMSFEFYNCLLAKGFDPKEATIIYREIVWKSIEVDIRRMWNWSSFLKKNQFERLKFLSFTVLKFPFSEPDYQWEKLDCGENITGFNCLKCPVAEFYTSKSMSEFCLDTWCHFDYRIANEWQSELKRSNTIAGGARQCDFRWHSNVN